MLIKAEDIKLGDLIFDDEYHWLPIWVDEIEHLDDEIIIYVDCIGESTEKEFHLDFDELLNVVGSTNSETYDIEIKRKTPCTQ